MADDLARLERWADEALARLSPARRRAVARAIGRELARANAERMRANVTPDGTAMAPRKPRLRDGKPRRDARRGRMFAKLSALRNLSIAAADDGVEISFRPAVRRLAAVHHLGLRDRVTRARNSPEATYAARPLLGFGPDDRAALMRELAAMLAG